MIPRSELLLDGDLFSLGDFLSSTSVSLGLDCLVLEETDWPSFKLLCTFLDDDMTWQVTRVCRQSCISSSDEGLWSVNSTTWVTLIGSPVKRPGLSVRRNGACSIVASQWACLCMDQSYIAKKPLGFEEHSRLHFPRTLRTNMQATFTYTPLKPCASIQKGRKRLHMSRQSRTADKNLQMHRSLEPVELISSCCKNNCFAKFDNLDSLKSLRSTFFNFGTQTLKKQFMKELLLAGIPDQLDYMDKQFRLGDIPVCYKYVHKLFGLSNTFLTSLKGTPHARHSAETSRPSRAGLAFHGMDFTKREHLAMWLNYQ